MSLHQEEQLGMDLSARPGSDAEITRRRARAHAHLERRRGTGRGRPRIRKRALLLIATIAAVAGFAFGAPIIERAFQTPDGRIARIAIRGTERVAPAQVARATGIAPGASIASVDPKVVGAALKSDPWIAQAKALPLANGTLVVEIVERKAVAALDSDGTLYAVDREGFPFARLENEQLGDVPQLRRDGPLDEGTALPELATAIALAERLPDFGLATGATVVVLTDADHHGFALELPGLMARIVLGNEAPEARLGDLARLLSERPDAVATATDIDLRFANQVVLRSSPAREGSASNTPERGRATAASGPNAG